MLPPPPLRLLPGGTNQFPGGTFTRSGPALFTAHSKLPLAARSADLAEHTLQACKLAHLVISRRKPLPCRGDAATVSHAKNRNVLILDAINYDVLINGKTARAHTKIVVARTPQVGMAGKQENRSVME